MIKNTRYAIEMDGVVSQIQIGARSEIWIAFRQV